MSLPNTAMDKCTMHTPYWRSFQTQEWRHMIDWKTYWSRLELSMTAQHNCMTCITAWELKPSRVSEYLEQILHIVMGAITASKGEVTSYQNSSFGKRKEGELVNIRSRQLPANILLYLIFLSNYSLTTISILNIWNFNFIFPADQIVCMTFIATLVKEGSLFKDWFKQWNACLKT